jgi:hypothetical protein
MALSITAFDRYLQAVRELQTRVNAAGAANQNQALLEKWHP